MSNREDIDNGRLIYTCNCGWIDLNHMDDPSTREFVGPQNLMEADPRRRSRTEAQVQRLCPSPS